MERKSRGYRWLLSLTIGLVFGVASLVVGAPAWIVGIGALAMLAIDRARMVLVSGALVGFGVSWSTVLLVADWRCQENCTGPDLTPWYLIGAISILAGVGLSVVDAGTRKARPT